MRILLVEDDPALGLAVRDFLAREAYAVDWVERLGAARACLPGDYACVVLDLGLPDGDGLALLPALRRLAAPPPVLILTARDRLTDRIRGLDAGADDYLVKPFDLPELAARLRALARRRVGQRAPTIEVGNLRIDPATRTVTLDGSVVETSAQEYALLLALVQRPGNVLSRKQLEDTIYPLDQGATSNVIEVYVSRLRRKLGRDAIRTVRGHGYRWGRTEDAPGDGDAR
jgi:two-component system, OmpR family, response regulator